jgi:predicted nucleotidyltransferase
MVYMSTVVPARVNRRMAREIKQLVDSGKYVSQSDAIRDALRRLVESSREASVQPVLQTVARIASYQIKRSFEKNVKDIVLFGSVARGRADEDSDIDLLVLLEGAEPRDMTDRLYDVVYPIMLASDTVITVMILSDSEFLAMVREGSGFARGIIEEGIQLYGGILSEFRSKRPSQ